MDRLDRIIALNRALAGVRVYLRRIEHYRALGLPVESFLTADALEIVEGALQHDADAAGAGFRAAGNIIAATPRNEPFVFAPAVAAE